MATSERNSRICQKNSMKEVCLNISVGLMVVGNCNDVMITVFSVIV